MRLAQPIISTATGIHIWERLDGTLDDVFDLQDRVASSVVGGFEVQLGLAEIDHASRKPTEGLKAYDLYLRPPAQEQVRYWRGA